STSPWPRSTGAGRPSGHRRSASPRALSITPLATCTNGASSGGRSPSTRRSASWSPTWRHGWRRRVVWSTRRARSWTRTTRTALFNWLFARQQGGSFLLRIEDTDTERNRDEWTEGIYGALTWLGLDWDERPVVQSERGRLYSEAVDKLVAGGHLYYCDCTREAVDARTRGAA